MTELTSEIMIIGESKWNKLKLHKALDNIYKQDLDYNVIEWLNKGFVKKEE